MCGGTVPATRSGQAHNLTSSHAGEASSNKHKRIVSQHLEHVKAKIYILSPNYAVQIICALFVYGVSAFLPGVMGVLKYVGAAYILYLAIHIAVSRPAGEQGEKSASFVKGFLLQFVNVKIYMFGITALTGFIVDYDSSLAALLLFEIIIATIGTIATCTWIVGGLLIQKFYLRYYRVINIVLALTLLECVYSMLQ